MANILRDIPNNFSLPRRINRLGELSYNLWWAWNHEGFMTYYLIDPVLWERINHNAVSFTRKVSRPRLNAVINDREYLEHYDRTLTKFDQYMKNEGSWFATKYPQHKDGLVAYFSFEFGLHESLPVYAGGLGILSGDHLKEASDLGIPLVGLGFIYNQGYFVQRITEDGWQETSNYNLNFIEAPLFPLLGEDGNPVKVTVDLPGRKVFARIWQVQVGRVALYLLDTNVDENSPADRQLTDRLYSNDPEIRLSQEILLGVGGVRALRLLGYNPTVWHMNEGHSAFLCVERIRELVSSSGQGHPECSDGVSFEEASDTVRKTNVFTTHTPVPAGNDQFPIYLIDKFFSQIWPELGLSRDQFVDMGRHVQPWGETFSMPVLALKLSEQRNAVSELHGKVSREMWRFLWPEKRVDDVPITSITNGIHTSSWLARRMALLFNKYLGSDWLQHISDLDMWEQVEKIPDSEFWETRQYYKHKLILFAHDRIRYQWSRGAVTTAQVVAGGVLLESQPLTIGFARRFATYKRAYLLMRDFDRLLKIITNPDTPVQIVFSGKAHPADEPGKLIIQQVYRAVKDNKTAGRLAFLEDYDLNVARYMVQGVDVWMNTPRRPNEASGTSGMKAALNGALNFSVLDGWWHEAYNGRNGWAIGGDEDVSDPNLQDEQDARSLYDTLENEIIPLYYKNLSDENLPTDWIAMVKESIRTLAPQFSMQRMVQEYMDNLYAPALQATIQPEKKPGKKNTT